jgi:hypothetical protein
MKMKQARHLTLYLAIAFSFVFQTHGQGIMVGGHLNHLESYNLMFDNYGLSFGGYVSNKKSIFGISSGLNPISVGDYSSHSIPISLNSWIELIELSPDISLSSSINTTWEVTRNKQIIGDDYYSANLNLGAGLGLQHKLANKLEINTSVNFVFTSHPSGNFIQSKIIVFAPVSLETKKDQVDQLYLELLNTELRLRKELKVKDLEISILENAIKSENREAMDDGIDEQSLSGEPRFLVIVSSYKTLELAQNHVTNSDQAVQIFFDQESGNYRVAIDEIFELHEAMEVSENLDSKNIDNWILSMKQ